MQVFKHICKNCKIRFESKHYKTGFCSEKCRREFTNKRLNKYYHSHLKRERKRLREWRKNWREKNLEKTKGASQKYWAKIRSEAFLILSRRQIPKCAECGCDNLQVLEIAHKNHDGNLDRRKLKGKRIELELVEGKRNFEDLRILCRLCNAKEDIGYRFNEQRHKIIWSP